MTGNKQQGVVLITTLIMLSVVTLMAVSFLAMSRRERASVTVNKDRADAKLMAETAVERARGEIAARIKARTNMFNYDFLVSTNFLSGSGFESGNTNATNVSYTYADGSPLDQQDLLQNLRNLQFSPRPPVFIETNAAGEETFRFYHDVNRNRRFEPSAKSVVGDPQWIGVLEDPTEKHSGTNRFIGRYAFMIHPIGKSLDINHAHNQAKRLGPQADGYFRNHGVGSWELNLAAFLSELNTNVWGADSYDYAASIGQSSTGNAFQDALALLRHRYENGDYRNLQSVQDHFPGSRAAAAFDDNGIDEYTDGPLLSANLDLAPDNDNPTLPWPGSPNANEFFDVNDLFSTGSSQGPDDFSSRLQTATQRTANRYDRYTFYRMLSQLSTDSRVPSGDRIHLNYVNLAGPQGNERRSWSRTNATRWFPQGMTNFVPWTRDRVALTDTVTTNGASLFFNKVADRLLKQHFNFGVTNIPIFPTNRYTAEVHQKLQMAANIYESMTNNPRFNPDYPTVFRPLFDKENGTNIVINGYEQLQGNGMPEDGAPANFFFNDWQDLQNQGDRNDLGARDNVYGIPLLIAAQEGYPNFNEFSAETWVQMTRKLRLEKRSPFSAMPGITNQRYIVGISNSFGVETWNADTNAYNRPLRLWVTNRFSMVVSNQNRAVWQNSSVSSTVTNLDAGVWGAREFRVPLNTNFVSLPSSAYFQNQQDPFVPLQNNPGFEEQFTIPRLTLSVTNRVQYMLMDPNTGHVLDFVNLDNLVNRVNVTEELIRRSEEGTSANSSFWLTERSGGNSPSDPPMGVINQIEASKGAFPNANWRSESGDPVTGRDKQKSIDAFRVFTGLSPLNYPPRQLPPAGLAMQAPFTPARKLRVVARWQANDPLVHYTRADLRDPEMPPRVQLIVPPQSSERDNNLGKLNPRYRPWGGNPQKSAGGDREATNLAVKDPEVRQMSDWQFPTNSYPNIGWLGRVHRGTPWQTIYLKSPRVGLRRWARWSGHLQAPAVSHPTNDWDVVGMFTTAPSKSARRGLVSVNQTNAATWAATLGGVSVLPNNGSNGNAPGMEFIEPATPEFEAIAEGIAQAREQAFDGIFPNIGSILATPELTVESPYLEPSGGQMTDEVYERIPMQTLSLLKADNPLVLIYAYGQSLAPADGSIFTTPGRFSQMPTNYRITGEHVTKTLVEFKGSPQDLRTEVHSFNVVPAN